MKTILEPVEVTQTILKSEFITYLFPVSSEQEAKEHINDIKKKHPKANHHCFAMVIDEITRSNDDHEPASTAGLPMLQTLLGNQLDHILAIVVRYFGGTLLGKGGLIRAYGSSVSLAIQAATIYQSKELVQCVVSIPFDFINVIETVAIKKATIQDRWYQDKAFYQLLIDDITLIDELIELTQNKIEIIHQEKTSTLVALDNDQNPSHP